MSQSFFHRQSESLLTATPHCAGPWHADYQHGGPPSALLARAIEDAAGDMHVARISLDLLKPVPIDTLAIELEEITGGKRRRVLQARLRQADTGLCVVQAQALLLRREPVATGALPQHDPAPLRPPQDCEPFSFDFFPGQHGYDKAMSLRREPGEQQPGRGRVWMKSNLPLVDDEPASALQRVLLAVDSGSGVSMALNPKAYSFINADLSVNLRRYPRGEWVGLDARSHFQNFGVGLCETLIWDEFGVIGNASQNLLLQKLG